MGREAEFDRCSSTEPRPQRVTEGFQAGFYCWGLAHDMGVLSYTPSPHHGGILGNGPAPEL